MRIVLVEPKSPDYHVFQRFALPRLGLPLLGTILRNQGHEVRIYCEDIAPIEWDEFYKADLVGISSITVTAPNAYSIADKAKVRNIPVVMGGVHPTFMPDEALEHCGYVLRGEAEYSLLELLEVINGERTADSVVGLSYKVDGEHKHNDDRPLIKDLDALPFPDITMIHGYERIKITPIVTSRGCPYGCTFCSVTPMFGRGYRFRSPENVLAEIEYLNKQKNVRMIFFYDDMFNAIRKRMMAILQGIVDRELKLVWTAQVRTNIVKYKGEEDHEALALMKKSGCKIIYIGFESVNPETLKAFNKEQDVDDIINSIQLVHRYGIQIHGMFVLGSDEDTVETVRETARFALENKIETVQFMILTPLPGSVDFKKLDDANRVFNKAWQLYNAHNVVYIPMKISSAVLQQEVFRAMKKFYQLRHVFRLLIGGKWEPFGHRLYGKRLIAKWLKENGSKTEEVYNAAVAHLSKMPLAERNKYPRQLR